MMWVYMCNWLAGDLRSVEDTELVGLVTAKTLGTVSMGTLHKKLTK
jgi:hypothetical protein